MDIAGKGMAKVATKIIEQTQQGGGATAPKMPGSESNFMKALEIQQGNMETSTADIMKAFGGDTNMHPADNAVSAENLDIKASDIQPDMKVQSNSAAADIMSDLNKNNLRMDQLMNIVSNGQKMNNKEMLLMQAAMHQLTFEAEMVVKVADAAKGTVQQLSRTQV